MQLLPKKQLATRRKMPIKGGLKNHGEMNYERADITEKSSPGSNEKHECAVRVQCWRHQDRKGKLYGLEDSMEKA